MAKRINVMLPDDTIRTLHRLAKPGERSRLIDKAVQHYASTQSREALRARLMQAYERDTDLAQETSDDWSAVDDEAWHHLEDQEKAARPSRSAAKSTSRRSIRR
jgi:CopG family transcriptional regulator / antitoxin EndoAI